MTYTQRERPRPGRSVQPPTTRTRSPRTAAVTLASSINVSHRGLPSSGAIGEEAREALPRGNASSISGRSLFFAVMPLLYRHQSGCQLE